MLLVWNKEQRKTIEDQEETPDKAASGQRVVLVQDPDDPGD